MNRILQVLFLIVILSVNGFAFNRNGERYSVEMEYSIISTCIEANKGPVSKVKSACICALKETQKEGGFKEYIMRNNYNRCYR